MARTLFRLQRNLSLDFAPNLKAEGKLLADITKLSIKKIVIWKVKLDKKS